MNYEESLRILRALSEGVDPDNSMAPFPPDSTLQRPSFIRAFFFATRALEHSVTLDRRRSRLPMNAGKVWSEEEDSRLVQAFDEGISVKLLAAEHLRSMASIRARLVKLGKLSETEALM